MPVELALYQPEIPQNAGTLIRLSACMGTRLHLIHPLGFAYSDKRLKRAGMDYIEHAEVIEHQSFAAFDAWRRAESRRLVLLTTRASRSAYALDFFATDILLLGRESAGVPDTVRDAADEAIRVPMAQGLRSINLALSAALVLGEALRQTRTLPGDGKPAAKM